ncbi:HAMP domain-containing sensor histidine kinase [Paenibacillus sp. FSL R10-2734]|uniref:sensor histidine kinase n=1 Tax=Paenibacillus sp. FSL R10-2734 TaxID=2954691 RepID=UPI0030D7111E
MNIKRRLTLKFVLQLAITGMVVLAISALTLTWILLRFLDISLTRDFASVGLEQLIESSKVDENGFQFSPSLLEQVKKNKGWLQSLNEDGQVESAYNTPKDVPKQYGPGELVAYWTGDQPFPYHLALWIQEKHGKEFTLVYGAPNVLDPLLKKVSEGSFLAVKGEPLLPDDLEKEIKTAQAFVQLIDSSGKEIFSYNRPKVIPNQYSVQELALRSMYSDRYGYHVLSSFDKETRRTWIVGEPNIKGTDPGKTVRVPEEVKVVIIGSFAMLVALLIAFVLLSLWQAHRFGAPMLHMLVWLDSIGNAIYTEPKDRKGLRRSRTPVGKWRRRYRVFADVMVSIEKLSATLKRDQAMREETENLREEWIAGVTHDLKTPLSSITGYAHLLAEPSYDWSKEEIRKFTTTMLDKSAHMDMLISDLAMTYRLKSGIKPPETMEVELNAWLQQALEQAAANPEYGKQRIVFQPAQSEVRAQLYTPWLERVVNNLTANALLHNPPDTILTVSLIPNDKDSGFTIQFADDGNGMDEETMNRLFERYYRGTDTVTTSNGSGLGMAISKGLIECMGGRITVESHPGERTVIKLIWS